MCDKPRTLFQQVTAVLGVIMGLYWANGKEENGNYHAINRVYNGSYWGYTEGVSKVPEVGDLSLQAWRDENQRRHNRPKVTLPTPWRIINLNPPHTLNVFKPPTPKLKLNPEPYTPSGSWMSCRFCDIP